MHLDLNVLAVKKNRKRQQHPKDFPGGHPPQYYPGLALLNFGVRMGSGVFKAVWPLTSVRVAKEPYKPPGAPNTQTALDAVPASECWNLKSGTLGFKPRTGVVP